MARNVRSPAPGLAGFPETPQSLEAKPLRVWNPPAPAGAVALCQSCALPRKAQSRSPFLWQTTQSCSCVSSDGVVLSANSLDPIAFPDIRIAGLLGVFPRCLAGKQPSASKHRVGRADRQPASSKLDRVSKAPILGKLFPRHPNVPEDAPKSDNGPAFVLGRPAGPPRPP